MRQKLTYVAITPYTLLKSRTGGIIARILAFGQRVRFVDARMYAPSDAMVDAYLATLESESLPQQVRETLYRYCDANLRPQNPLRISNRMMVLLFEGEDPITALEEDVVGKLSFDVRGDTIRGTYGDAVFQHGELSFFEPAILMPSNYEANARQLRVLSDFAVKDGGILTHAVKYDDPRDVETTLVIIKPDNFWRRSSRPGNMIDVFSREGLYIVGAKVVKFSQQAAEEFYRPLRAQFVERLKGRLAEKARQGLSQVFDFPITPEMAEKVADVLKEANAEHEFRKITNYMSGQDEAGAHLPPEERGKCVALLYQGKNAIAKIRRRLGATNPEEAQEGTVRSIFAYDLMKNGAHASDSRESAERERKVVGLWEEGETCSFKETIDRFLAEADRS